MSYLPDATKIKLAEALRGVNKAASHWEKCLLVQIEGFGMFSQSAADHAEECFDEAFENAKAITEGKVDPTGLLRVAGDD